MTVDKGVAVLLVDFNSGGDEQPLVGRFEWAGSPSALLPGPGDRVKLRDFDGNECEGLIVAALDNDLYRVSVEWDSWTDAEEKNQVSGDLASALDLMDELRSRVADLQEAPTGDVSATRGKIWEPA